MGYIAHMRDVIKTYSTLAGMKEEEKGITGRILLHWILKRKSVRIWTGLIWRRME
jgi:hypothetical protein